MARREIQPSDYESNADFVFDLGIEITEDTKLYDCSLCAAGKHEECQEHWTATCKCFLSDHEESW